MDRAIIDANPIGISDIANIYGLPNPLALVGADGDLSPLQERYLFVTMLSSENKALRTLGVSREEVLKWLESDKEFKYCYEQVKQDLNYLTERTRNLISLTASLLHYEILVSGDNKDKRWAIETAYRAEEQRARGKASDAKRKTFEEIRDRMRLGEGEVKQLGSGDEVDAGGDGLPESSDGPDLLPGQVGLGTGSDGVPDSPV